MGDMLDPQQRAWVTVNLAAIRHNLATIQAQLQPDCALWAVVKANAYGHGALRVAATVLAAGATGLCVATLAEAVELRQAGITAPILILAPLATATDFAIASQHQLEITLAYAEQLHHWQGEPLAAHVIVDTGMSRLGIPWQNAAVLWQHWSQQPNLHLKSLYSHMATADEPEHPLITAQHERFQAVLATFQAAGLAIPPLHLANSAATLLGTTLQFQQVRVGLALYGFAPAPHFAVDLQPALTVQARITQLKWVEPGTGFSYGQRCVAAVPMYVATVAVGYADGIPRRLSGWLQGHIRGKTVQQIGTVTMDQTLWDVTPLAGQLQIGDCLTLLAPPQGVEAWATQLSTISYEIICGLSGRLPRVYVADC